jgi:hypothetical protein
MGVETENPVTRLLGAAPALGTPGCKPGIATVSLRLNLVLIATGTPPDVSPETAHRLKPLAFGLASE